MTNFLAFIFLQGAILETVPLDQAIPALGNCSLFECIRIVLYQQ